MATLQLFFNWLEQAGTMVTSDHSVFSFSFWKSVNLSLGPYFVSKTKTEILQKGQKSRFRFWKRSKERPYIYIKREFAKKKLFLSFLPVLAPCTAAEKLKSALASSHNNLDPQRKEQPMSKHQKQGNNTCIKTGCKSHFGFA